jgi:hypothetical protein
MRQFSGKLFVISFLLTINFSVDAKTSAASTKNLPFIKYGVELVKHCECDVRRKKKDLPNDAGKENETSISCLLDGQNHKLKDPSQGFPCDDVLAFHATIQLYNGNLPMCLAHGGLVEALNHGGPNGGDSVGNRLSAKGARHYNSPLLEADGAGWIEFKKFGISGVYDPNLNVGNNTPGFWFLQNHMGYLEDDFLTQPTIVNMQTESFHPVKSVNSNVNLPESERVFAEDKYLMCDDMLYPGTIAVAYCEIKNGNGIVVTHTGPSFDHTLGTTSTGNNDCLE